MSNLQAKLASAVLIGVAANVCMMATPGGAARAADNCITEPRDETPQGKHWYFRIERGTGRHCWYLRGEDEAPARTPSAEPVAAAKPTSPTVGNAPPRSLADAHAELAPRARVEDNGTAPPARSVWPDPKAPAAVTTGIGPGAAPPATPADSQVTTRWPQASGAPSSANSTADASLMVADAQAEETAATTPATTAPPQASPPQLREVGSLQKLALVAFAALALAGITGSLVYRLADARSRRRRQQRWPQRQPTSPSLTEQARGAPWVAPELSPTAPHVDVEVHKIRPGNKDDSFEKIEDFLARLTRQLQDELQTTRSTEMENQRPH
jgi:hypothetical protein